MSQPRRVSVRRLCLLLATLACTPFALAAEQDRVTVLTWEAFVSPKVLTTFKNREKLTVEVIEFTTPEERDRLLKDRQAEIDVVVADTIYTDVYKRRGLLEKLDAKRIPAMRHVMKHWRTQEDYAVPYLWGHTGIAWRTDKVKAPLRNYADLFALAKENPGQVALLDDAHEALRAALYAFGKAPWSMDTPAAVAGAESLLKRQRKYLRLVGSELGDDSPWLDGRLIAGQAYNGDIAYLRDTYNAPLAFAIPSPGCMIFHEQLTMLKSSRRKDAAYRFLELITQPAYAARNAEQVRYAPANPLAVNKLSAAFRDDPVIRPTFDGVEGCYFYAPFPPETRTALDRVKL